MTADAAGRRPAAAPPHQLHAVILSGSGADAAYEVGVLKALCGGRSPASGGMPITPDVFAGTATGAFNACLLVSRWADNGPAAVEALARVWRDRLAWNRFVNGNFRMRLNPLELLDPLASRPGRSSALGRLWGDVRDLSLEAWTRASRLASGEALPDHPLLQPAGPRPGDPEELERLAGRRRRPGGLRRIPLGAAALLNPLG